MGVFSRPDSPYWWLYLEPSKEKERTDFLVGTTTTQRHDSKKLALDLYHQRMNDRAARRYRLPTAQPAIRFDRYADAYAVDTIAHHKGHARELEILTPLRAFFGDALLASIDSDRVRAYCSWRLSPTCGARTINREIDLLKSMLRDAAPKYVAVSPLVGFKKLKTIKPKRRLMTADEERKLLAAARDPFERALLIVAVDSLVRLTDLIDLKRSDRDGRWIYIADPKSENEAHDVALSARGAKALDALSERGPYFFWQLRGGATPRARAAGARFRLKRMCESAGIAYGKKTGGITFHWATRRTGATRMLLKKKIPLTAVQRQGTWKHPAVLLEIYAEADKADMLAAVAPFPSRSRSKRKSA